MSLFGKGKKRAQEEAAPEVKRQIYWVNISGKSVRADVADSEEGTYFKGCHLWAEDGKIRAFKGKDLLFEVTNKSKAYKELEPLVGKPLTHIVLRKKTGDYGLYYMASIAIEE